MPHFASRKQMRYFEALKHGSKFHHARGNPPKSVIDKYSGSGKDLPESKDKNTGGSWDEKSHKRHKHLEEYKRHVRAGNKKEAAHHLSEYRKHRKSVKKSEDCFADYYNGRGTGIIVVNKDGKILIGKQHDGRYSLPGGHVLADESYEQGAIRELKEETGIDVSNLKELYSDPNDEGNKSVTFLLENFNGSIGKNDGELKDLSFKDLHEIDFNNIRHCSAKSINEYISTRVKKSLSLKDMLVQEELAKNILRGPNGRDAVYEVSHGDALKLVGNSTFRFIKKVVADMKDEDFKEVDLGDHKLHIRRHISDVYSGRIYDGHKLVHQFTNRSLPQIAAELMSVFEWYMPEDEDFLNTLNDESVPDEVLEGGIDKLVDNYKRHNIGNIYAEMENIRKEIRNDNTVDLQLVESRIMKLFDKLELYVLEIGDKHNILAQEAGKEIEILEQKLKELQGKLEENDKKPTTIEAFTTEKVDSNKVLENDYPYLTKPCIEISPDGKIKISFNHDWSSLDKENLLKDMKAKIINKKKEA